MIGLDVILEILHYSISVRFSDTVIRFNQSGIAYAHLDMPHPFRFNSLTASKVSTKLEKVSGLQSLSGSGIWNLRWEFAIKLWKKPISGLDGPQFLK